MQNIVSQDCSEPHCYYSHWLLPSVSQSMTDVVQIAPFSGIFIPIQATPGSWTPCTVGNSSPLRLSFVLHGGCIGCLLANSHGLSRHSTFTKDCFCSVCPSDVLSTHTGFFTAEQLHNAELTVAKTAQESWVLWCGVLKYFKKSPGFSSSPSEFHCQKLHQSSFQPVHGLI